ncbi:hypothetical protein [Kitasatospora purpeofusca]|uniref:Uncharacterized protein n=1 Tax=Kitasatospora purpeofusca TaxID=67352 RepID=A0ABZ1U8F9_9ACTN|nr:hypothetical protein [Kitasatospora purpeofusca]
MSSGLGPANARGITRPVAASATPLHVDTVTWAAITIMTRRITQRQSKRSGQPASRGAQRD